MNNKTFQLYLDQNDHWLGYVDSNGNIQHVRTDVQIDIDHIRITDDGFLQILNKGTWEDIKNDEGNLVSLKGPKGDTGETGPQGPQGEQGLQGRPSIFKGSISTPTDMDNKIADGAQIGDSYIISGVDDSMQLSIEEHNGAVYTVIANDSGLIWVYSGNIRGQKGADGKDGADGQNGVNGKDGANGLTPYVGENGNWWIGTEDTGVQAEGKNGSTPEIRDGWWYIGGSNTGVQATGKDGKNPFTEEEVATLNALPEALNIAQSQNSQQFQSISEQIKEVSDNLSSANKQNAGQFSSAHSRINALETRLAALEQILSNIDLASLTAAYPKPEPEPTFTMINSCVVKDEASYQTLPESYRSKHGEWGVPGLQESLPWLAVEFSPIPANQLQIKVTGPNNFEKEISYPDVEKEVTLLTLNEEELKTELITGPWTININGAQTTLIVDRDVEE